MKIRVCSGWHPAGRAQYGNRFLASFAKHWPASVELQVYVEEAHPMPRNACRLLWDIAGACKFNDRVKNDRDASGLVPKPCWKSSEIRKGYSFRTDAAKFWKQLFIPGAAAQGLDDGDILIWLDGDVVTTAPITEKWLHGVMGDADLAYLGREPSHSELGFWAIRINDQARAFLAAIEAIYTTGKFRDLPENHSAYVWDYVRHQYTFHARNLCKPGARGHVFPATILAPYLRHDKGPRKTLGIAV